MENKVEILREYLNKKPGLLSNVKAIMDYRNLRTEQRFSSLIVDAYRRGDERISLIKDMGESDFQFYQMRIQQLDRKRGKMHNTALGNFMGILRYGREHNLPELYSGVGLTEEEIQKHINLPEREKVTDSMFGLLADIEEENIKQLEEIEKEDIIKGVKKDLERQSRLYHVKKPLREDEGDIEFY